MPQVIWTYPAIFDQRDGEVIVSFPDIPEALTGAATLAEAQHMAVDALQEAVLSYLADGRPVPAPRKAAKGEVAVPLEPLTAGRAAVSQLMAEQHVTNVALAGLMHKDEKVVRRILDGSGSVGIATVTEALRALGAQPSLSLSVA
jgi:antitoxin HicB